MALVRRGAHGWRCAVVALVVACATGGVAAAQERSGANERRRAASDHVKRGDALKEAGDYEGAARAYEQAYELVPHPVLIFNLGQVYRLKGDSERALDYYERYLAVEPHGLASAQAREFADLLRIQLERRRAKEAEERWRERAPAPDRAQPAAVSPTGRSRAAGRGEAAGRGGRGLRIAGLASAGAGLVALGLGVKFGLDARKASDDINAHEQGEWPDELLARQRDGERAERNMFILTGVGAAALAGGGLLYYWGVRRRGEKIGKAVLAVTPAVAGDDVGLVVSGRF